MTGDNATPRDARNPAESASECHLREALKSAAQTRHLARDNVTLERRPDSGTGTD